MTQPRIAIVGTGPTGLYVFDSLVKSQTAPHVTLFERRPKAGIGMPYSTETNSVEMLANIASIEIPPLMMPYLDWLKTLSDDRLDQFGLRRGDLDERLFTPRILLGDYFHDQLMRLCSKASAEGAAVTVLPRTEIVDVVIRGASVHLVDDQSNQSEPFDYVVLATGHDFPDEDEATGNYFPSPWSGLIHANIPATSVAIMGTSLSSIDAAMAVVNQHGSFEGEGDDLTFTCTSDGLHITMMSWTGVLPEADFYCPIPYAPLQIMTEDRVAHCAQGAAPLDDMFALLQQEIGQADPAYAQQIALDTLTPDSFADAYFAQRTGQDPFGWARKNLAEVERNKAAKITVAWRYALLRMHEVFETIVPDLSDHDRKRFDQGLKIVFTDNYAAVPSQSIRRLLALRDAGVLSVLALGEDYTLTRKAKQTIITAKGKVHSFDVFIDARGQKPLKSKDIPFPSLRAAVVKAGQDTPTLNEQFFLTEVDGYAGRVCFAALPWLMQDRPFVQGITASAEMGQVIAAALVKPALAEPEPMGKADRPLEPTG